jgi:hypothetical protein
LSLALAFSGCVELFDALGVNTHSWSLKNAPVISNPAVSGRADEGAVSLSDDGGESKFWLSSYERGRLCVSVEEDRRMRSATPPSMRDVRFRLYGRIDEHWPTEKDPNIESTSLRFTKFTCEHVGETTHEANGRLVTQRIFRCQTLLQACFDNPEELLSMSPRYLTWADQEGSGRNVYYNPASSKVTWALR